METAAQGEHEVNQHRRHWEVKTGHSVEKPTVAAPRDPDAPPRSQLC